MAKKPNLVTVSKNVQSMLKKSGLPADSKVTIAPPKGGKK